MQKTSSSLNSPNFTSLDMSVKQIIQATYTVCKILHMSRFSCICIIYVSYMYLSHLSHFSPNDGMMMTTMLIILQTLVQFSLGLNQCISFYTYGIGMPFTCQIYPSNTVQICYIYQTCPFFSKPQL